MKEKKEVKIIASNKRLTGSEAENLIEAAKKSASRLNSVPERRFWGASLEDKMVLNKIFELKQILNKINDPRKINDLKERIKMEEDKLKESVNILAKEGVKKVENIDGAVREEVKEAKQTGQRLKISVELAMEKADQMTSFEQSKKEMGEAESIKKEFDTKIIIEEKKEFIFSELNKYKDLLKSQGKNDKEIEKMAANKKIGILEIWEKRGRKNEGEIGEKAKEPGGQEEKPRIKEGEKIKLPGILTKETEEAEKAGGEVLISQIKKELEEARSAEEELGDKKEEGAKVEKRKDIRESQQKLDDARKEFANIDRSNPNYSEIEARYKLQTDVMKDLMYRTRKDQLETKGLRVLKEVSKDGEKQYEYKELSPDEAQKELEKYSREIIVPHFAVVEAAKIQNLKTEQTFIEKAKDSRVIQVVSSALGWYRKLPFKRKIQIAGGLIAAGAVAGVVGGAVGGTIAGAALLGKVIQRTFSAGGTFVATEAMTEKIQRYWMSKSKEGWGKNRHEYVSKKVSEIRERVRDQEVREAELEEIGGMQEIKENLDKRKKMENKLEKQRAGIALAAGALVGSGAASYVVRQLADYSGLSDFIAGKLTGVKEFFSWTFKQDVAPGEIGKIKHIGLNIAESEKIAKIGHLEFKIGSRGPEGAIIDQFNNQLDKSHELAKSFGWDGKVDLHKWAGAKAHILWHDDALKALENPKTLIQLDNLGYSKDLDGYAQMMRRMGKGIVELDVDSHKINLVDTEYLKNSVVQLGYYDGLTLDVDQVPGSDVAAADSVLTVDQVPGSDIFNDSEEVLKNVVKNAKERGLEIGGDKIENLQNIMNTPESKFGYITSKLYGSEQRELRGIVARAGGLERFMKLPASELFYQEGQEKNVFMEKLGLQLKSLTGDSYKLHDNVTPIKKILESIGSEKVYGGTAKTLFGLKNTA